ncbi:MAG: hypothetical protein EOP67_46290 [Sphingomonas sp.]|nr:MAG: hypothetical protein EOP67_46290 [Sphingomonas sp.]
MARAGKLKVYRTAAGFHDAYVAAPSQKAALAAWGSEHDLFARGIAELVTDADLAAEPLASPGVVIKRSRGTTAEQIAALPTRAATTTKRAAEASDDDSDPEEDGGAPRRSRARTSRAVPKPKPETKPQPRPKPNPKPKPVPRPSRRALDTAEEAYDARESEFRRTMRALADREAALARERRTLEASRDAALATARAAVDAEKRRYDAALAAWKG